MDVVIMAGGEGSRLRPLTCDRPKPMVPVINKPVMEHTIELCKQHGFSDIGVTLQYMPEEIRDYFGDGSDWGVTLKYFVEKIPMGTAGSIKNGQEYIDKTFLVISGDALTDIDLSAVLNFHRQKGSMATLVLKSVQVPLEYGVVITEEDGRIKRFLEKPSWGEVFSDTVNTGIYVLEPEVLRYIPEGKSFDFSKDLFPRLLEEGLPLYGCVVNGYWCDIGNLGQYQESMEDIMKGEIILSMPGEEINPGVFIGRDTHIHPSAKLVGPLVIGDACVVGANAVIEPYTVIGNNCSIGDGATLKKSTLWNNVYVGTRAELRKAVLCNRVQCHEGASVFEGSVIGDGTIIEAYGKIKTNVKIWPEKKIDQGAIVNTNFIWGRKNSKRVFGAQGISGIVNMEITPEYGAKLAAAFASTLGANAQVTVSSDMSGEAQMIKRSFIAGLMSAGIKTFDTGNLVTPIQRYAVRAIGVERGIHIKTDGGNRLTFYFFDAQGVNISKGEERKIENLFSREDFPRAGAGKIGRAVYTPGVLDSYQQYLKKTLNSFAIRSRGFKLVMSYDLHNLSHIIPPLLNELNCDINLTGDNMSREIEKQKADLGIIMDDNAEILKLMDNKGRLIEGNLLLALVCLIMLKTGKEVTLNVPVTATEIIEKMAAQYKGRVVRTKTAPQYLSPEMFDNLAILMRVLDFLAVEKATLAEVVDEIPEFYMTIKTTECPWPAKGQVMRKLIEEKKDEKVELIDGIKVYHDKGWALVLPDAERPIYHVFSEAANSEYSEELANMYINKINDFKQL